MSKFDDLGVAAMRKLRAQQELAAADAELALQVRGVWCEGTEPKCRIGKVVRDYLTLHGFGPEEQATLGVSDGSIRNMLDGKR